MLTNHNHDIIVQNRKALKKILNTLSIDQVNRVPAGFNNNILWNVGHTIVVQQMLTYGLTENQMLISPQLLSEFRPGTKPQRTYDHDIIEEIKTLLFSTHETLMEDAALGKFNEMRPFMTAIKFEITDIHSAIAFDQYHEALHMGQIINLMRFA